MEPVISRGPVRIVSRVSNKNEQSILSYTQTQDLILRIDKLKSQTNAIDHPADREPEKFCELKKKTLKFQFTEQEIDCFKMFIRSNLSFDARYYLTFKDLYSKYENELIKLGFKKYIVPKKKFWFLFDYEILPETVNVKKQNRKLVICKGVKFKFCSKVDFKIEFSR